MSATLAGPLRKCSAPRSWAEAPSPRPGNARPRGAPGRSCSPTAAGSARPALGAPWACWRKHDRGAGGVRGGDVSGRVPDQHTLPRLRPQTVDGAQHETRVRLEQCRVRLGAGDDTTDRRAEPVGGEDGVHSGGGVVADDGDRVPGRNERIQRLTDAGVNGATRTAWSSRSRSMASAGRAEWAMAGARSTSNGSSVSATPAGSVIPRAWRVAASWVALSRAETPPNTTQTGPSKSSSTCRCSASR